MGTPLATRVSVYTDPAFRPKLDPSYYHLQPDELAFFQLLTGINDEDVLKQHILSIQAKAYELWGYPCILGFWFIKLKISRLLGYKAALELLKERNNPILLDMGCCFGNDARKAVVDCWPVQNVIASDLRQGFWDYGHELFKSTPETFRAAFIPGDIFDPAILAPRGAYLSTSDIATVLSHDSSTPPLNTLTSLTPLQGKISAIHASAFFHLFPEEQQLALAHLMASLLRPEPGSVIFGQHGARTVKGYRTDDVSQATLDSLKAEGKSLSEFFMFCHSPESWRKLWVEDVFGGADGKGEERVRVDAELRLVERRDVEVDPETTKFWLMDWCITRL
ncbi:hypothetical protein M413DRAFT_446648 [Hebeloma cylindrosporum]|uniref:Methyltransferase domain-containing protein n=1 Tax=Hebeloma cylindrosporum TaxID=76867 RepID=A0A0C3BSU1_HEBCY|nr:hypothetical protein M413DRAFT_446648 [Hebeloma cylindrosporum h7]